MEVISLWHGWGGMEAQVSLTVAFSSSAFFDLLFLIFLLTIPHRFSMGFRSGEFAGQSSTPTPWSFNQLVVLLAVWTGAKSCWKMKSASFKSWSAKGSMQCSKIQNVFNIRGRRPTDCRGSKGAIQSPQQCRTNRTLCFCSLICLITCGIRVIEGKASLSFEK